MQAQKLAISDVIIIKPKIFEDHRGFFYESFNQRLFESITGVSVKFVQDNHSFSKKNTLRGLHFQHHPHRQGKLVRAVSGRIFDVAVDLRKESKTFGKWVSAILSAENRHQLWIPPGFAHGFLALEDSQVIYKTTSYYHKNSEESIFWDDPDINIIWPNIAVKSEFLISQKDLENSINFSALK